MLAGMVRSGSSPAPGMMRVVRAATLPVREELYIEAGARPPGCRAAIIVTRHVLPRIAGAPDRPDLLLAAAALGVQTGLAFSGLLVAEPAPSWGGMVADGRRVRSNPG